MVEHGWCRWLSVHVKQGERTGKSKVNDDSVSLRKHGDCSNRQWTRALIRSRRKDESKELGRVVLVKGYKGSVSGEATKKRRRRRCEGEVERKGRSGEW